MVKKDLREVIEKDAKMFSNFINSDNEQYVANTSGKISSGCTIPDGILFKKDEIKAIVRYLEFLIEFR